MRGVAYLGLLAILIAAGPASASECPGNPGALGTSRTIVVDPTKHNLLGGVQYRETLPLNDKEVVITFDDGPLPPYSTRILNILAQDCVKATFFMVGRMARSFPKIVRRVYEEGHTLANHSQNHPFNFRTMPLGDATREIEDGFDSIAAAVGDPAKVAPFFRFPGLHRQQSVEQYLASKGVMSWSLDFLADDWTRISSHEIVRRALERLEAKGKGILLLHDIQPATALGLPTLLSELNNRGYRIVHVVPASAGRAPTVTTAEQWQVRTPQHAEREISVWPRAFPHRLRTTAASLQAPSVTSFGAGAPDEVVPVALVSPAPETLRGGDSAVALPTPWPEEEFLISALPAVDVLPAPAAVHFRYTRRSTRRAQTDKHRPSRQTSRRAADADITGSIGNGRHEPKAPRSNAGSKPGKRAKPDTRAHTGGKREIGHQIQISRPTASLAPGR